MRGSSREARGGSLQDDPAGLQHIAFMGDLQGEIGVLLDHEDRDALAVDRGDQFEHAIDEERRQAHGRLVHAEQARAAHQRARHRDHLLLAARQRAGALIEPLGDARKQFQHAREIVGDGACGRSLT